MDHYPATREIASKQKENTHLEEKGKKPSLKADQLRIHQRDKTSQNVQPCAILQQT
jgi:hypothetical protein